MSEPPKPRPRPSQPDSAGAPAEDSLWARMARELATNPDSPASLRIMSSMGASLAPRGAAAAQLEQALAHQIEYPGQLADAAVAAAVRHWEAACGGSMDPQLIDDMRQAAARQLEQRRAGPPPMESILPDVASRSDFGYDHRLHLEGLRGTWHRLWAIIGMESIFGDSEEHQQNVAALKAQFEEILGRALTEQEMGALRTHALKHGERVRLQRGL